MKMRSRWYEGSRAALVVRNLLEQPGRQDGARTVRAASPHAGFDPYTKEDTVRLPIPLVALACVFVAACSSGPTAPASNDAAIAFHHGVPGHEPPANAGNGAGKSANCTGPNDERPSSCKSQGGPGNP